MGFFISTNAKFAEKTKQLEANVTYTALNNQENLLNVRSSSENLLEKDKINIVSMARGKKILYSDSRYSKERIESEFPEALNCIGLSDKEIYTKLYEEKQEVLLKILEDYDYSKNYYQVNMYNYSNLSLDKINELVLENKIVIYSETELNDKYSRVIELPVCKNEATKIILKFNKVCENTEGSEEIFIAPIIVTFLTDINIVYITLPKLKKIFMSNEDFDILLFKHVISWLESNLGVSITDFDIHESFDNIDNKIDENDLSPNDYQIILTKLYNEQGSYISLNGAYNRKDPGLPIIKNLKELISEEKYLHLNVEESELTTDIEKTLFNQISETKQEIEDYIRRFKEQSDYLAKGILDKKNNKMFVLTTRKIKEYNDYNYIRLYMGNFDKESIENVIRFLYENRTID
jgi:hypothetical protein